jgi:outer membrane lipoprotein SlyB
MEFVDKAFARRLEAAEEMPQVHYAGLYQKLRPEIKAAAEPISGGHMIFAGVGSLIGRAVGKGTASVLAARLNCCPSQDLPKNRDSQGCEKNER